MDNKTLLEHIREKRREIFGCSPIRTVWEALEAVHEIEEDIEISESMSMPRKTGFIPPELSRALEGKLFEERQEKSPFITELSTGERVVLGGSMNYDECNTDWPNIEEKDLPKKFLFREEPPIQEKVLERIKRMEENKEEHFND